MALPTLRFDNRAARELAADPNPAPHRREVLGAVYSRVRPTPVAAPRVLAYAREMLAALGYTERDAATPEFAEIFGGNALAAGMDPISTNYGGHQFGSWAGQLGDGRAISLGEVIGRDGGRYELQLKGAGPTPYSRMADGRAVLRSSVREFLCSEAMHHLGIPTTRALCLVGTGEEVVRDMFYDGRAAPEPGAIVCRVAPSFIRFGHFELPASRGEHALVRALADFTIRRDYAGLAPAGDEPVDAAVHAEWFAQVCERTAEMVAHWQRVGFVHGVMNTDNMSILGLTIDYGPYGWLEEFDLNWTPNTTDASGRRYRFGHQPQVAYWNLCRLAGALLSLFPDEEPLHRGLERFVAAYQAADRRHTAAKLGLASLTDEDAPLLSGLRDVLTDAALDMTLFYRTLCDVEPGNADAAPFRTLSYDLARFDRAESSVRAWLAAYGARVRGEGRDAADRHRDMSRANPRYVARNYLAQIAIDRATQGDVAGIEEFLEVLRRPYEPQPGRDAYAAKRPEWARDRAGCSMLSCSS